MKRLIWSVIVATLAVFPAHGAPAYFFTPPPTQSSCGGVDYSASKSIEKKFENNLYLIVAKVSVGITPCGHYVDLTLTNYSVLKGSGASQPDGGYTGSQATASVTVEQGFDDGTFTLHHRYRLQDESENPWRYFPDQSSYREGDLSQYMNGFVQLTASSFYPTSIQVGGSSVFAVQLLASNRCGGDSAVQGYLTALPGNSNYRWDGKAYPTTASTKTVAVPGGGNLTSATFMLEYLSGYTGQASASTNLGQLPQNCDARGPLLGGSLVANLLIQ